MLSWICKLLFMKIILHLIFLIISFSSYCQLSNYSEFKGALSNDSLQRISELAYGQWVVRDKGKVYHILFKSSVIGCKRTIDKCKELCRILSFDFEEPTQEDSYLSSTVSSIYDYEHLYYSIYAGNSIVTKRWKRFNGTIGKNVAMSMVLDEKLYAIIVQTLDD